MSENFAPLKREMLPAGLQPEELEFVDYLLKSWPWLRSYDAIVVEEFVKTRTDMDNLRADLDAGIEAGVLQTDRVKLYAALEKCQKNFHTCAANLYRPSDSTAIPAGGETPSGEEAPGYQTGEDMTDEQKNVIALFGKRRAQEGGKHSA